MLKRLPQDRLEDESIGAVATFFNSNGWEFNRQGRDKSGIDGEIEIIHGVERTGRLLKCQVKAGTSYISSETENQLRIRVERKYLEHWEKMNFPVLLFFYHPTTRSIFWKAMNPHFASYPALLMGSSENPVIVFDKEKECLEAESLAFFELVETGTFSYDSILMEPSRTELGWSNWFPVATFPTLWEADAKVSAGAKISSRIDREYCFTIQGTTLLTFSNLRDQECELRNFVEVGSIKPALQDTVASQVVVELLNQAALFLGKSKDLLFRGERFYFSPALLKSPESNVFAYSSLKGREETRTKIYIQRMGTKVEYKHHAVRFSFLQHLNKWFLQLDPDWYFTYPYGQRPSRQEIGARITSEKANTHNKDYLYLLHFWRQFLSEGKGTISFPCARPFDGTAVGVSSLPLEFDFHFRLFNEYVGSTSRVERA